MPNNQNTPTPTNPAAPAQITAVQKANNNKAQIAPPPHTAPNIANRGVVDMTPSLIPLLYGAVILALILFPNEERRTEIRRRLNRDRDYFLGLALIPIALVLLSYILNSYPIVEYLAWAGGLIVPGIAAYGLLGPDRPELQQGLDLPEDIKSRLD